MSNNHWLRGELMRSGFTVLSEENSPLIELTVKNKTFKIYAPGSDEYLVTLDLVERIKNIGGDTIVYSNWCSPSAESTIFGDGNRVEILSNREFFRKIRK